MTPLSFSRGQMIREATLTEADRLEVAKCRRDHNRLGFAYQVGFVRLFHRFPAQQPLEACDELLHFVSLQVGIDEARIADYAPWQHTTSEHQGRIRDYLKLAVEEMPFIPLMAYNKFAPFDTTYWTGYPSAKNPYSASGPFWSNLRYMVVALQPNPDAPKG